MNEYTNILVAVDGSEEAKHALLKSIEFAKLDERVKLYIVHVIDMGSIDEDDTSYLENEQQRVKAMLTRYQSIAEDKGIENIEVHSKTGDPKVTITKELAPFMQADLIVCGAQGLKNAEHYFIGSVSEAIVLTATCDVWVSRIPK